jgi:hypothetical protein
MDVNLNSRIFPAFLEKRLTHMSDQLSSEVSIKGYPEGNGQAFEPMGRL